MDKNRAIKPEPRYRSMDVNRKLRKKMEKSNITAKRVTLLPGFLSRGVKSETVRKSTNSSKQRSDCDDEILKGDLHGLLQRDNPPQLRRSSRLSKKSPTASSYFLEVIAGPPSTNRSKSIFREIKEKYARKLEEVKINQDFGARLFGKLDPSFALKDSTYYKDRIIDEIVAVNEILAGKLDPDAMSLNRKRHYSDDDKENFPIKFPYVPQSKWVFQTPPNRKLNYSQVKVEDNSIKPAVVENCNDGKIVYEMNGKINVDLSGYSNRQEINIDKRYMVEVTNLPSSSNDITFECRKEEEFEDESGDKKFQFIQSDPYELENHFLSLTCRPKKVPMTVSRVPTLKRKRDIFEPEQPGCSTDLETVNEFESNFTFINNLTNLEESFTLKFTADDYPNGSTTGHLFDYDGNKKDSFNFRF